MCLEFPRTTRIGGAEMIVPSRLDKPQDFLDESMLLWIPRQGKKGIDLSRS